jgi:hypothetical protein
MERVTDPKEIPLEGREKCSKVNPEKKKKKEIGLENKVSNTPPS